MIDAVQILAVSEISSTCEAISYAFQSAGHKVVCVASPMEALRLLHRGLSVDFIVVDAALDLSGENFFLPAFAQSVGSEKLCLLTHAGNSSWKEHATDWTFQTVLAFPLVKEEIDRLTQLGTETFSKPSSLIRSSVKVPHYHLEELDNNRFFMAASPTMMQLYRDIRVLAPVDIPVLILGESGVGKENVAMLLHKYHARSDKKLMNINCAALPNELLESELFGFEAGAFTGAIKSKPGLFEMAHKGTLLLDEIGEMSPQMQAKLLHVLQDGTFCRLGARSASHVDVRVLAATNINMHDAIAEKRFREDLFYRLNTLTITVPPLRERREEIPLLLEQLFHRGGLEFGQPFVCSDRIVEAAQDYHWPGNFRELRNFVTRTLILRDEPSAYQSLRAQTKAPLTAHTEVLAEETLIKKPAVAPGMKDAVNVVKNETEIRMLQGALSASGWNRRRAATNLNISYRTLLYKIQQHGLRAEAS